MPHLAVKTLAAIEAAIVADQGAKFRGFEGQVFPHMDDAYRSEAEDGFRSLAVPVRRYDGEIVAAINVGAHVDRISTGEMLDRFLPPLKNAAAAAQPLLL